VAPVLDVILPLILLVHRHVAVSNHRLERVVSLPAAPTVNLVNNRQPLIGDPTVERAVDIILAGIGDILNPDQRGEDGAPQSGLPDALPFGNQQHPVGHAEVGAGDERSAPDTP
jgi:hypothetical protein